MDHTTARLGRSPQYVPAPARARRFASMMYEGVLLFGVVFVAGYLLDTLTQSRSDLTLRHARQVWLFLAIAAYFVLCWRRSGQTLTMKAWNIRLISADGGQLSMRQMIVRYVCMWLLPVGAALVVWALAEIIGWPSVRMLIVAAPFAVFLPTWFILGGQFWHDKMARTLLVDALPHKK